MTFKKYINQIYLNALNSNKLRNSDHFWPVCIVKNPTSVQERCCGAMSRESYHLLPCGHTKAAFYNKRMSQFVLTGDQIIIEVTVSLFADGNRCSYPVINDIMTTKSHIQV